MTAPALPMEHRALVARVREAAARFEKAETHGGDDMTYRSVALHARMLADPPDWLAELGRHSGVGATVEAALESLLAGIARSAAERAGAYAAVADAAAVRP